MKPSPFSKTMTFFLIFLKTNRDIGNIIAASDRRKKTKEGHQWEEWTVSKDY